MELILNLVWICLVAMACGQWLRAGVRDGSKWWVQAVSLAMLVLILFPVVSVTDDLQAALSPAEIDCCLRRDHACAAPHSIVPAAADIPYPESVEISLKSIGASVLGSLSDPIVDHPALSPIENRPPPAA